jgi:hypothetical protein
MNRINRRVVTHGLVAVVQIILAVPALLWWRDSVLFVIGLSLFANFYSAISALEAADNSEVLARLDELEQLIKNSRADVTMRRVEGMS